MIEVIYINLGGRILPIEKPASTILNSYLSSIKSHFNLDPDANEIITDIENRIAELLFFNTKKGTLAINEKHINVIIKQMGLVSDFNTETNSETINEKFNENTNESIKFERYNVNKILGGVCSGISQVLNIDVTLIRVLSILVTFFWGIGIVIYIVLYLILPTTDKPVKPLTRKLFKDSSNAIFNGVLAGLANYFKASKWYVRLLFIIPFCIGVLILSFKSFNDLPLTLLFGLLILYFLLDSQIPNANTPSDVLQMNGDPVNINTISNNIKNQVNQVNNSLKSFSKTANFNIKNASKQLKDDIKFSSIFININTFIKWITLSIVAVLLVIVAFNFQMLKLISYWFNISLQQQYLVFVAFILLAIRVIWFFLKLPIQNNMRSFYSNYKIFFGSILSFVAICLLAIVAIAQIPKYQNICFIKEKYTLLLPKKNIHFSSSSSNNQLNVNYISLYTLNNFFTGNNDSFTYNNTHYNFNTTSDTVCTANVTKIGFGNTKEEANQNAQNIKFTHTTKDNFIKLPLNITIYKPQKFVGQFLNVQINIPNGIKYTRNLNYLNF